LGQNVKIYSPEYQTKRNRILLILRLREISGNFFKNVPLSLRLSGIEFSLISVSQTKGNQTPLSLRLRGIEFPLVSD